MNGYAMTHDQLLIEVKRRLQVALYNGDTQSIHALLAVIELNRPMSDREPYCNKCKNNYQGHIDVVFYPCPTIQAIIKELR